MSAPYMPLYVSDYLSHTAHLSAAENGAYMLLIMNYWQRMKPLPADPRKLARIARMSDAEWAEASESLSEFFQEIDGTWVHKRIEVEIAKAADKIEKAKNAGKAGGKARKEADAQRTLNGCPTDADLLDEMRLAEIIKDASKPASLGAGQFEFFIEKAESLCIEAAGSDGLGEFLPIAGLLRNGVMSLADVLEVLRSRPAIGGTVSSWKFYAKIIRDEAAKQPRASPGKPTVFVKIGTPAFEAWQSFTGKKYPALEKGGWFFDSEWPPTKLGATAG